MVPFSMFDMDADFAGQQVQDWGNIYCKIESLNYLINPTLSFITYILYRYKCIRTKLRDI